MLNQALRYAPIMEILRDDPWTGPILEIGAGANGLARYVTDRRIVGVDLKFGRRPHARMSPVIASADALPFPDRSFSLVVCSDMLEHIPSELRPTVVREMIRVSSRRVVLAFPAGPAAIAHDRWLHDLLGRLRMPIPDWLDEHLQLDPPAVDSVIAWAEVLGASVVVRGNANRVVHQWLTFGEEIPPIGFVTSRVARRPLPATMARAMSRGEVYRTVLEITPAGDGA